MVKQRCQLEMKIDLDDIKKQADYYRDLRMGKVQNDY